MNKIYNDLINRFDYQYFFTLPAESKAVYIIVAFYVLVTVAAFAYRGYLLERAKEDAPYRDFAKRFFWPIISITVVNFTNYSKVSQGNL